MARNKIDKGVTLIAPHTEVIGDVRFANQLYVSGKVTGNLLADSDKATVVVGEEGVVAGKIRVPNIVINEVYSDPGGRHDTELFTEDANNDGMSDRDDDEFVELVNTEDYDVDMSGYVLLHNADGAGVVHRGDDPGH